MSKRILCMFCKKEIHIDKFAGITKDGSVCNSVLCVLQFEEYIEAAKLGDKNE